MVDDPDRLIQALLDASPTPLLWVGEDGVIARANRAAAALLGYGAEEWAGLPVERLLPEALRARHATHRRYYHLTPEARPMGDGRPIHALRQDGTAVPVEITLRPMDADLGGGVVCALVDVSARQKLEASVRLQGRQLKLSQDQVEAAEARDPLTGLHSRSALFDALESRLALSQRSGRPLSLLLMDADHFKALCDEHGSRAGDQVLRQLAALLRSVARRSDVVARYGGDRFAAVLPDTNREGALQLAERLRKALRFEDWAYGPVTASFGVETLAAEHLEDPQARPEHLAAAVLERACQAIREAKAAGRDRVVHADAVGPPAP